MSLPRSQTPGSMYTHRPSRNRLFIVEGLMTVAVGLLAAVVLPPSLDKAKFLTPEQRLLVVDRLQRDKPQGSADVDGFSWYQVNRAVFSIQVRPISPQSTFFSPDVSPSSQTWLSASAYFCLLTALYSFGLFVPTMQVFRRYLIAGRCL